MRAWRIDVGDARARLGTRGEWLVIEGEIGAAAEPLAPAERDSLPSASPARMREFAMGRALARELLSELGAEAPVVTRATDRSPRWPDGFTGSISHTCDRCVVAVARTRDWASIGIDMEPALPLERELWPEIASRRELARIERLPPHERGLATRRLFVVKEAVYKCLFPLCGKFLEFQDVEIAFEVDGPRFEVLRSPVNARVGDLRGVVETRADAILAMALVAPRRSSHAA